MSKLLTSLTLLSLLLAGCTLRWPVAMTEPAPQSVTLAATPNDLSGLLEQSWQAYRQRFIQGDGRVIDREANDRSTSEGQAYALLRAVWMNDQDSFDRVLQWSETNLQRRNLSGQPTDRLWVWKWGQQPDGNWGVIDSNFASDGDIDAITALIFAAQQWNQPRYLELAKQKLEDLWNLSTVSGAKARYLLPGPREAFQPQPNQVYLNPSYFAPYAFRLFAQIDPSRDWLSLVDSSYQVLEAASSLSAEGLPSDWISLDLTTGNPAVASTGNLQSRYSFDAYRVWWRVALDAAWFNEPRARRYLQQQLQPLVQQWQSQQKIPAQIDLQGQPLVDYESTAQYAMLYAAFQQVQPDLAEALYRQKLLPAYRDGFWDNDSAYYVQNLGWLGLFPVNRLPSAWFQARAVPRFGSLAFLSHSAKSTEFSIQHASSISSPVHPAPSESSSPGRENATGAARQTPAGAADHSELPLPRSARFNGTC